LKNKGVILILLLLIVASCSAALTMITLWVSKSEEWSNRLYVQNRAYIFIYTAFKVSKELLKNDSNNYDSRQDIWANIPPMPIRGGDVSITLIPTNSKIDLNLLFSSDLKVKKRTEKAILKIFTQYGYEKEMLENLRAWCEKRFEADTYFYTSRLPPIRPRKTIFYSLKEVDFVKGMSNFSKKFHRFFTVNGSSKININFASKEVIESYIPEIEFEIDNLLSYRKKYPFKNITQIKKIINVSDETYLKIQPFITTKSDTFIVKILVNIDSYRFIATGIIKRDGKKVKLIKYFEGKGFYG